MIEATCSACGTLNRIAETDVPTGAKFVACASCKSRLPLPNNTMSGGSLRPPAAKATLDLADLPAPKRSSPLGPAGAPAPLPKGAQALNLDGDLPAPKAKVTKAPPLPTQNALNLDDFLAPAEPDLPAPKARGGRPTELPATKSTEDILDLPAPKSSRGVTDLPGAKSIQGLKDLPPAKGITDLPQPKGIPDLPGPRGVADLPAPKGPGKGSTDLPMPKGKGSTDLPMPKGSLDLPAPKGFFDDLPQPSRNQAASGLDLPAPKGFFDDLPQPSRNQGSQDLPAPLGFFEDLPQKKKGGDAGVPAPKGYFEDLPQRAKSSSQSGGDELTPLDPSAMELDVKGPALDLAPSTPLASSYNDIDISKPSLPPSRIAEAQTRGPQITGEANIIRNAPQHNRGVGAGGDSTLELEADSRNRTPQLASKRKDEAPKLVDATLVKKRLNQKLLAGIVAGLAVLGGGGFFMYRRHAAAAERQDLIDEQITKARAALAATDAGHWQRAATAAKNVLDVDETDPEGLALGSEAAFGAALDEGASRLIPRGRKLISDALAAGISGPPLARAQGLNAITMGQYDNSIAKLTPMLAGSKDGYVALYLGWAQAAKGDLPAAIAAYDLAAKTNAKLAVSALYGRGKAKLVAGDLEGARADFQAVIDLAKDHIGAQVGLAAAQPSSKASQQEADLLAILQRKDINLADPRAVVGAWVLAGNDAARGARGDAARERYRKALEINPNDVGALTGLAEVEMKDGKLDTAMEAIVKALDQAKDDAHAQMVASDLAVKQNRLDDAEERIRALTERQPPLPPLDQAHLLMTKGHLLEAQHKDAEAIEAYVAGAKLAGDLDLAPTMAAVAKLSASGQAARVAELLGPLEAKADGDPQLALTLGNGYLQAGLYEQAEKWLRRASDARPTDPDAMFQLAKAMARLGHTEDAIAQLKKAMEIDPSRAELGLELARTYEEAEHDDDATQLYEKLLTAKTASLELRGRAGKYFARKGMMDKASAQGVEILKAEPNNPAGLYLKAEGLLSEGRADEARKLFHAADAQDRDAQYFDGEGRAAEKIIEQTGDTKWVDVGLNVYNLAHQGAPKMFNPLAGEGRLYLSRREWKKAADVLTLAWKLNQKDGDVAFMLGVCAQELLDKPTAMQWFAVAQKLKALPEASRRLGTLYREANNAPLAIDALRRATSGAEQELKKTGKSPAWLMDAYYDLGDLEFQTQDWHAAREAFEKWKALGPVPGVTLNSVNNKLATSLRNK